MNNLLESFFILFSSDADDVRQGAESAADSTDKLDKKLKETDHSAKKVGESFTALASRAAMMLAPLVGLSAMRGAVLEFAAGAEAAGALAESLRMDVVELQAWQGAASRAGGSAEGLAGSVKSLNATLRDMRRGVGGEAGSMLRGLGISAREAGGGLKTADKVLLELSGKIAGLSREKAMLLGEKLGLDESTILLLLQGKKGVEDLLARQKELGLYSKKEAEDSKKFNNSLADMKQAFNAVAGVVIGVVLPIFTGINKGLTEAALNVRRHKDLITGFFIGLAIVFGALAIATGAAFAPFLAFAAIVLLLAAAFAVAYDDVMNFLEGNDSMIGKLSQDYPALGELVMELVELLRFLWEVAKAVGAMLVECIKDPTQAFENFSAKIGPLLDNFTKRFPRLGQAIKDIGVIIKALFDFAAPLLKKLMALVGDVLGWIFDKLGKITGLLGKAIGWVASKIRGGEDEKPEEDFNLDEYLAEEDSAGGKTASRGRPDEDDMDGAGGKTAPRKRPDEDGMDNAGGKSLPWERPGEDGMDNSGGAGSPPPELSFESGPAAHEAPPLAHTPWNPPAQTLAAINQGKNALAQTNAPFSAQSFSRGGGETKIEKTYQITVDKVEVITQAMDAEGMASGAAGALERQLRAAIDNFDDGVAV